MKFLTVMQIVVSVVLLVAAQSAANGCNSNRQVFISAPGNQGFLVSDVKKLVETLQNYTIPPMVDELVKKINEKVPRVLFVDTNRTVVKDFLRQTSITANHITECSGLNRFLKPLIESCPDDIKAVTSGVKNRMRTYKEIDFAYGAALVCSCMAVVSLEEGRHTDVIDLEHWKFWGKLDACISNSKRYISAGSQVFLVSDVKELVEKLQNYEIPPVIKSIVTELFNLFKGRILFYDIGRDFMKNIVLKDVDSEDYYSGCQELNSFLKPLIESGADDIKAVTSGVKNRMRTYKQINFAYGAALVCSSLAEKIREENPAAVNLDDWKFWGNLK